MRVLIGSTQKMGAGTNVQDKLIALHDLDCPWRPRDLTQRKGRIERRGNENEKVHVFRYVTEATFDAYLWQTVETKALQRDLVLKGEMTHWTPMVMNPVNILTRLDDALDEMPERLAAVQAQLQNLMDQREAAKIEARVRTN